MNSPSVTSKHHSVINPILLGRKIRGYRVRAGLTQLEIELALGMSVGSLCRIERGLINPTKETIILIAKKLNLSPEETAGLFEIEVNKQ